MRLRSRHAELISNKLLAAFGAPPRSVKVNKACVLSNGRMSGAVREKGNLSTALSEGEGMGLLPTNHGQPRDHTWSLKYSQEECPSTESEVSSEEHYVCLFTIPTWKGKKSSGILRV